MSYPISMIKYISIKLELHTLTWRVTPNPWRRSWESKAPLMLRLSAGITTLLTSSKVIIIIKSWSDSWENFKQNRDIKVQMSNDEWKYTFSLFLCFLGQKMYDVNLKSSPRVAANERPISLFQKIDAAICDGEGVKVMVGNHYYHFDSPMLFIAGKALPEQRRVSLELFGCDH